MTCNTASYLMVSMSLYQNIFFKFEIKFSVGWRHTSWSNWKNPPKNIERYQTSDKDLPTLINKSKQLFYAYESVKESPMLMSKQIYIDAVWKEKILMLVMKYLKKKMKFHA